MTLTENITPLKIQSSDTIENLIRTIQESGALGCALVYQDNLFLNIITDGDIRRCFLSGYQISDGIDKVLSVKEKSKRPNVITANVHASRAEIKALFLQHSLRQLVLVNNEGDPVSVIDHISLGHELLHVNKSFHAVVMAGGFGTRLRPLTLDTPKPMLPINGRPLLEILIAKLVDCGAKKIYITTHYLPEKIMDHFGDGHNFGVPICYIHEDIPLGTGGALGLVERPNENMLVINGDILTDLDFSLFHAEHIRSGSVMTIAGTHYSFQVPFGVLTESNGRVLGIEEKPKFGFMINSGIYFISRKAFDFLPHEKIAFTMPQLAERLIAQGETITCFPIFEQWLDIGRPEDYRLAVECFHDEDRCAKG